MSKHSRKMELAAPNHARRRLVVLLIIVAFVAPIAGYADDNLEKVLIDQLKRQGYSEFVVSFTLLGRMRILAIGEDGDAREIVVNPRTGEVLRDVNMSQSGRSDDLPRLRDDGKNRGNQTPPSADPPETDRNPGPNGEGRGEGGGGNSGDRGGRG